MALQWSFPSEEGFDYSDVINTPGLSDITITHKATNKTWHLHSQALYRSMHPKANPDFIKALEDSRLDEADFAAFLLTFYSSNFTAGLETACHWECILECGGLQYTGFLSVISSICRRNYHVCFQLLLKCWFRSFLRTESVLPFQPTEDSPIYQILFKYSFARFHEPGFKVELDSFLGNLWHTNGLYPRLTSFLSHANISKANEKLPSSITKKLHWSKRIIETWPIWTSAESGPLHLTSNPANFLFQIQDTSGFLMVCGWKLYCAWPWFRDLVDIGLEESNSRLVTFPPPWDQISLQTVVVAFEMKRKMPIDDNNSMRALLAVRHEYGLPSTELLDNIIDECEQKVYHLTCDNAFEVLQLTYDYRSPQYFEKSLAYIRAMDLAPSLTQLASLSPEVIVLFSSPTSLKTWKATLEPSSQKRIWNSSPVQSDTEGDQDD